MFRKEINGSFENILKRGELTDVTMMETLVEAHIGFYRKGSVL